MISSSLTKNGGDFHRDFDITAQRADTSKTTGRTVTKLIFSVALGTALFFSGSVLAEHISWHKQSRSYDVHLGVVPASVLDQDPDLARMHRLATGGEYLRTHTTQHILVAVYRKPGNERVTDAEVVVELVESDLVQMKKTEKRLEMMHINGLATFCNFFELHWNGKYRVNVTIDEQDKASEMVSFLQEASGLAE